MSHPTSNSTDPRPTSIRIFLADGTPDGIRIVDKSNWTGRAVVAGRPQVPDAIQRKELDLPGVYVLVGPGDGGESRIYVGEGDMLGTRIKQHATGKDFWTRMVAFSSTDGYLNKAHVRYLEARLIALAQEANQWEIDNGSSPGEPPLSEADRADAEWFLSEMLLIFPILGIDAFEVASKDPGADGEDRLLYLRRRGSDARGRQQQEDFVVLEGSLGRITETASIHAHLSDLRTQLKDRGVLLPQGKHLVFTQDYRFSSPSKAAGVLVGGAANGRVAWKTSDGRTLKEIQNTEAEQVD